MEAIHVFAENLRRLLSSGKFRQSHKVSRLRKTVHNGENGGIALGWGEAGDEVHSDVGPGTAGDGDGLKKT